MTSSDVWTEAMAERYDREDDRFGAEELSSTIRFLQARAAGGRALEFAIGTGRVAGPLRDAGVPVTGIELSEPMVAQLRRKADADRIPVVVGDMATAFAGVGFGLVYLVYNTIGNLKTQDEQVACFENAARHLAPGGRFVIEVGIPELRRLPPGQLAVPFALEEQHLGFDTYDLVRNTLVSHHYTREADGRMRYDAGEFRYVWPAELDLMARIAGLVPEERFEDFTEAPFTSESAAHVSVWRKA